MSPAQASADRRSAALWRVKGLYAVTPDDPDTEALTRKVRMAIAGGARIVQYRNKSAGAALRREQGTRLLALCRASQVPLIINDDLDLAVYLGADGLHLGRDDAALATARARLGRQGVLGMSCYNRLDLAIDADRAGADYVAFGSAFVSSTKPDAVRASLSLYREAKTRVTCPVVAIGGITTRNAQLLVETGVDAIAVISDLFDAPDIEKRSRELARMFANQDDLEKRSAV